MAGADVEAVCREAATNAVREHVRASAEGETTDVEDIVLTMADFEAALEEVKPSTGDGESAAPDSADIGAFG